jgi:hypothetical protein
LRRPGFTYEWAGGKADPFFEIRKAHGAITDENGKVLLESYSAPNEAYMGTKEPKSIIARSNIVRNCLNPVWFEVEIELGRYELPFITCELQVKLLSLEGYVTREIFRSQFSSTVGTIWTKP